MKKQRIKGHKDLRTQSEFRKLKEFRRLYMMNIKNQAQKFMNQMKNMQGSRDLNKSQVKYID